MLVGLVPYFMLLFGGGQIESFYILDFEKGVENYVTSISRRDEAKAILSVYASAYQEFIKAHKKLLKELQKKNLDYTTTEQWYKDFFIVAMEERRKLQASFISGRLRLQDVITEEEWTKIIELTSADVAKLVDKKKKKREKKEGNDVFQKLSNSIKETIPDVEKKTKSLESLNDFKDKYKLIGESYENMHESESEVLTNRQASREEMQEICNSLNKLRESLSASFIKLLWNLKDNTSEKEWSILVKDFNKL